MILRRSNGNNETWATPITTSSVSSLHPTVISFSGVSAEPKRFILVLNKNASYSDDQNARTVCLYWDKKQVFWGAVENVQYGSSMSRGKFLTYSNVTVEYDSSEKKLSITVLNTQFWPGSNKYTLYYSY